MRLENSFLLLPGVGEKTERELWQAGVTHWDAFEDADIVGPKTHKKGVAMLEKARKNLDVGNTAFFDHHLPGKAVWRIYENFQERVTFFDIETTGLNRQEDVVTTASFHRDGETTTLVRGQDLTAERVEQELFQSAALVSFNGKRFDIPFLEASFDLDIETPHIDLMYLCRRLGLSGGLKRIEQQLGIDRDVDVDGREAIRLWKRYKNGSKEALEDLVYYNQLDVINLRPLLETVHERLRGEVFEPHLPH